MTGTPKIICLLTLLISLAGGLAAPDARAASDGMAARSGDHVLLLHGIARTSRHMDVLAGALREEGYRVINLDYPSRHLPIEDLSAHVAGKLAAAVADAGTVHIVGYSMGGLVARGLVRWHRPTNLGRVVQLASPNCGSEVADLVQNRWLYQEFYGPAGQQLVTTDDCHVDWLGGVDYDLGIIAGDSSIDPASSWVIDGPDDGKVAVRRTRLDGAADHIVLSANHTFFPQTEAVITQTIHFLKHGSFDRGE